MSASILLATRNHGKAREFQEMLGSEWTILTSDQVSGLPEVVEDGGTFEANAQKKALEFGRIFPGLVLADDSGLEVDALGGAPGIYSARYAGEPSNDRKNNDLLLARMADVQEGQRGAQFVCALVMARGPEVLGVFKGILRGRILKAPSGQGGFGYDPLFVPDGYELSFGELGSAIKNSISHRSKALIQLQSHLASIEYKT